MTRFDECLPHILRFEGGYVDDPADRGGATNKGITQGTYDAYRERQGLPLQPVKFLLAEDVSDIYLREYWDKCRCDELPAPLDLCVFDAAVQHGPTRAIKLLQLAAGVVADGIFGEKTARVVQSYARHCRVKPLIESFMDARSAFYAGIIDRDPSQKRFARGWANRLQKLETALA